MSRLVTDPQLLTEEHREQLKNKLVELIDVFKLPINGSHLDYLIMFLRQIGMVSQDKNLDVV